MLSKASFKEFLRHQNRNQGPDDKMFDTYDHNNDGEISCDDFVGFCKDTLNQGKYRRVALKFMKNEDQFQKEIKTSPREQRIGKKTLRDCCY